MTTRKGPLQRGEEQAIRAALLTGDPYEQWRPIQRAALAGPSAAGLVPDLLPLLTSEKWAPCTTLDYDFGGHDVIARSAMQAIESIGVPPPVEPLLGLLADERVFLLPEASYDQGAYIGDYFRAR